MCARCLLSKKSGKNHDRTHAGTKREESPRVRILVEEAHTGGQAQNQEAEEVTDDEARQIVREHYQTLADSADEATLRQKVRYLSGLVAEYMDWEDVLSFAQWIKEKAHGHKLLS